MTVMPSYLTDRRQFVVLNKAKSTDAKRGFILGPLMFVLFINEIGSYFTHSWHLIYADDLKLYKEIRREN